MRRPIKHIVQGSIGTNVAQNTTGSFPLVVGSTAADPYSAVGYSVNAGSSIVRFLDIEIEAWVNNKTNASLVQWDTLWWYVWFNLDGAQTPVDPANTTTSDTKNQIFHQEQSVIGCSTAAGNLIPNFSKVNWHVPLKIPKEYQAINKGDHIDLVVRFNDSAAVHNLNYKVIFKEFEQA